MRSIANQVVVCISAVVLLFQVSSQSQNTDPNNDTGTHAYQTYDGARENVSVGSGNVFVSISLLTLPGRNGHNYSVGLISNSQTWSFSPIMENFNIGMVVTRTGAIIFNAHGVVNPDNGIQCTSGYSLTDEQGGVQTFSALRSDCVVSGGGPYQGQRRPGYDVLTASDDKGEGLTADLNACKVTFKDGSFAPLASSSCPLQGTTNGISPVLEDSNGNEIVSAGLNSKAIRTGTVRVQATNAAK